ncbi:MAG TPA: non-reducing end alpha-L-arabinofuranosidase family hydrolase [Polyangia bacterium]|nr:non-reducing end alpha-L-arabinofuranosidase family hydrolase [Polyangia bacterium]
MQRLAISMGLALSALAGPLTGCSGSSSSKPASPPLACGVPTTFAWSSTGPLLGPTSDATHDLIAIKDPSVVYANDKWNVFASSVDSGGNYNMVYLTFPDWDHTAEATTYYMDQTPGLSGYHAAPQVFFFAPQNTWYLVYQSGPPTYSTNDNLDDPTAWTPPLSFFGAEPAIVTQNKGSGGWLDFWVICDDVNCYLFFSDDNGHWYRSQTTVGNFPHGFGDPAIVLQDANPDHLFEASNVYKMAGTDQYLAMVEAFDATSGYHRYFRSWTADTLDGDWTPLADTFAMPFASTSNVTFTEQPPWTQDISHGEMIRAGIDQTLVIDTCHLQFLYQGLDPTMLSLPYNSLPWRLGLLTSTVSPPRVDGGSGGAGGAGGAGGGPTDAGIAHNLDDTFTTANSLSGFALGTYADPGSVNLAGNYPVDGGADGGDGAVANKPTLAWVGTDGSPDPGALQVTATFTSYGQYVDVVTQIAPALDLSNRVLKAQVKLVSSTPASFPGGIQFHASAGASYTYFGSAGLAFGPVGSWSPILLDLGAASSTFDATMIVQLGIQVYSGSPPTGVTELAAPITVVFEIDTITD